jgi:hypothetical protein
MRKASLLIGFTVVALAAVARAQEPAPASPAAAPAPVAGAEATAPVPAIPAPSPRRAEIGLSILPMGVGKLTLPVGGMEVTGDASFAYGVGLSASYRILAGLSVGLAPQVIFNVQDKVNPSQLAAPAAATEVDLMARVAYTFPVVETIGLYVEALPGFSLIGQPNASTAKGLVVGLGVGVAMDLTEQTFANIGVGYQIGLQTVADASMNVADRTRYLRLALGGGMRF